MMRYRISAMAESHAAGECGLKQKGPCSNNLIGRTNPAWGCGFQILTRYRFRDVPLSHPAWVCGLKQKWSYNNNLIGWSHPAWVCGLKHYAVMFNDFKPCHTLRGCVDWNTQSTTIIARMNCHTLRGCIWIEALFTRWSSLWKNCKHSASCVFLFKLL